MKQRLCVQRAHQQSEATVCDDNIMQNATITKANRSQRMLCNPFLSFLTATHAIFFAGLCINRPTCSNTISTSNHIVCLFFNNIS